METTITVDEYTIEYICNALQFTMDTMFSWVDNEMNNNNLGEAHKTLRELQSYLCALSYIAEKRLYEVYKNRLEQFKTRYEFLTIP